MILAAESTTTNRALMQNSNLPQAVHNRKRTTTVPLASGRKREFLETAFYSMASVQFWLLRVLLGITTRPKLFELTLRSYLKRPEWLYGNGVTLEIANRFTVRPKSQAGDRALCKRLIAAYQSANMNSTSSVSSIWEGILQAHYLGLHEALESRNPESLSKLLSGMFQSTFLYGISSSSAGLRAGKFIRMKLTEELLALAEALGVVRTEVPEQGVLGYGLSGAGENLVRRIEEHLGMSIDFPDVGGAYGIEVGGRLITPEAPEHIYVARRITEAIRLHLPASASIRALEIGAGFGGTAYWLMRMHKIAQYTIIDLPLMNVCQGYFLAKVFGDSAVQLFGETNETGDTRIDILPTHAKDQAGDFNLLLNENSMPEIPEAAVQDYLLWARRRKPDLFYSYNQEAYSPGRDDVPQTLVPQAVAAVGGFKRLSRNYSWIRRGYVEEAYAPSD